MPGHVRNCAGIRSTRINTNQVSPMSDKVNKKNMTKTKFGVSGFYKPTPAKFRKVGDGLLVASTLVSAQYSENPKVMLISQIVGLIAKLITNLAH
jgi:hypothetical protein